MVGFWYALWLALGGLWVSAVPDGGLVPKQLLLALAALAGYLIFQKKLPRQISLHGPEWALLAWWVWQISSAGWAVNGAEVWAVVGRWAALLAFYLWMRACLADAKSGWPLLGAAAAGYTLAQVGWVVYQAASAPAGLEPYAALLRLKGTAGNKNLLALGLLLAAPALGVAAWQRQGPVRLYALLAGLCLSLVFYLQGRAVWLGAGVGLGVAALGVISGVASRYRWGVGVSAVLLALVAGLALARLPSNRLLQTDSMAERLALWRNTRLMIADAPLLGRGAGQWQIWFPAYGVGHFAEPKVQQGQVSFQRPHNDTLWLWAEGGLVGLGLFTIFFAGGLWAWWQRRHTAEAVLAWVGLGTLAGYAAAAQFDFPLERPDLQALWLLWMAAAFAGLPSQPSPRWALPTWALVPLACLSVALGIPRIAAEQRWPKLRQAAAQSNLPLAERQFAKAHSALSSVDATTVPLGWYVGVAALQQRQPGLAQTYLAQARAEAPFHFLTLNALGTAYAQQGRADSALALYDQALQLAPNLAQAHLDRAAVLYSQPDGPRRAFEAMRAFPDTVADPRWPLFKRTLLGGYLQAARAGQPAGDQARIDALLQDPAFPARAYTAYRRSGRSATFWR